MAQAVVRAEKRPAHVLEEPARRAPEAPGDDRAGRGLPDKPGRGRVHVRDRHRQEGVLPDGRLERHHGRLDPGAAERAAAERHQAAAQPGRPEADGAGLGHEGEERAREKVLVRPAGQDVPVL